MLSVYCIVNLASLDTPQGELELGLREVVDIANVLSDAVDARNIRDQVMDETVSHECCVLI